VAQHYPGKRAEETEASVAKKILSSQGLKLQCEGHDVRYRNAWIKEIDVKEADTSFSPEE
jgi:hypothetical protein